MKRIVFLLGILLVVSCNSDNGEQECAGLIAEAKTDVTVQSLFIDIQDDQGNNLIDSGRYVAGEITLDYGGNLITGVVFEEVESIKNLIQIGIYGVEGDNYIYINLNKTERDTLTLNLNITSFDRCLGPQYNLNSVLYNGVEQVVESFSDQRKITVIK